MITYHIDGLTIKLASKALHEIEKIGQRVLNNSNHNRCYNCNFKFFLKSYVYHCQLFDVDLKYSEDFKNVQFSHTAIRCQVCLDLFGEGNHE